MESDKEHLLQLTILYIIVQEGLVAEDMLRIMISQKRSGVYRGF